MEAEDHEDGGREWTCAAASQGMPRVDSYLPHPLTYEGLYDCIGECIDEMSEELADTFEGNPAYQG